MTGTIRRADFSDLPHDVFVRILSQVGGPPDLARIARTSRAFQTAVADVVSSRSIPEHGGRDFTPQEINNTIRALVNYAIAHDASISIPDLLIPTIKRATLLDLSGIVNLTDAHLNDLAAVIDFQQLQTMNIAGPNEVTDHVRMLLNPREPGITDVALALAFMLLQMIL